MVVHKEDRIDMSAAIGINSDGTPHYAIDEKPGKGNKSIGDKESDGHSVPLPENVQPTKGMEATQDNLPHPWLRSENKTTE